MMEFLASALDGLSVRVGWFIYAVIFWEAWRRLGWPMIVGNQENRRGTPESSQETPVDDSGYDSEQSSGILQPHTIPRQVYQDRLDDFVDASNYALQSAYPKPQATGSPRYSKVSVLLIQWQLDDLGVFTELEKLYDVFNDAYGYDCEPIFEIPERDSQMALMACLQRLISNASRDHLLIVYYGGHSDNSNMQQCIWRSHQNSNASSINWNLNQAFLLQCPSDVLIILDTCYAGKGGSNTAGPTLGANEVIAATNEVIEAPGVSRFSFTRVLVKVLKNFADKHRTENLQLSAVWLCTHMRNCFYDHWLKKPPYYVSLVNYRFESCRIIPRPSSRNSFLGTLSPLIPPDLGPFRVTVAIYLRETPSGDLVSWLQNQGAPAGYIDGVELIKIQAAHLANSAMILVTMPPAVWLLLPPDIPCTFVGLVRSDNLLTHGRQNQRQLTAVTSKAQPHNLKLLINLNPPPTYEEIEIFSSRSAFEREIRRQNKYWTDRASQKNLPPQDVYNYYSTLAPREFRLLKLFPGLRNDKLRGQLKTVEMVRPQQFTALSYVWGPRGGEGKGQQQSEILLEDFEAISREQFVALELRPNLASALQALRSFDKHVYIWVDALCINQVYQDEETSQIPLMVDIYRLSENVVAWLGGTTPYGKLAFSFASWVAKNPDLLTNVPEQQLKTSLTAFFDMIRNPWFQRKWIVQDIAFAKDVNLRYGEHVLPWKIMADAISVIGYRASELFHIFSRNNHSSDTFLDLLADFEYQAVNVFIDIRRDIQYRLSESRLRDTRIILVELVIKTVLLKASMFHDSVYSMVSLAPLEGLFESDKTASYSELFVRGPQIELSKFTAKNPAGSTGLFSELPSPPLRRGGDSVPPSPLLPRVVDSVLRIDYSLSIPQVSFDFVALAIKSTRRLDIICRPWAPEAPDLPSWVCLQSEHSFTVLANNRSYRVNADALTVPSSTNQTLYSACGKEIYLRDDELKRMMMGGPTSLFVRGFALGTVNRVEPPALNGVLPKKWRTISQLGGERESDFWRTLVADRDPTGLACPAWYELANEQVLKRNDGTDLDTRRLMFQSPPGIVFDFLKRVQSVIWGRRLAILDERYLMLSPRASEVGDIVCILHGCSVPVLLRRERDRDSRARYIVIGECYVHGMMDGEACKIQERDKLDMEEFELV